MENAISKVKATIRGREDSGDRHKIFIEFDITLDPQAPEDHAGLGRATSSAITDALLEALRNEAKKK